jgi:hypothetical protein
MFVAAGAAGAQGPRDLMKISVFYSVPGTEAVRVEREIVFRTAGDTMLKADIYLPAARGTYPLVLLAAMSNPTDEHIGPFLLRILVGIRHYGTLQRAQRCANVGCPRGNHRLGGHRTQRRPRVRPVDSGRLP